MSLSIDEKSALLSQLEGLVGVKPLYYLKFTSCDQYAIDVKNGDLYANTPEWFRERERTTGQRGQGDRFELTQIIDGTNFRFINEQTNQIEFIMPRARLSLRINDDDNKPIVSFVGITLRDMIFDSADEKRAVFRFPFSDEEFAKMEENFGKYCVIVDAGHLLDKIMTYSASRNVAYLFDKVIYCPNNTIQRLQSFGSVSEQRFLYKDEDLYYQREYRLVFDMAIPSDHFIRLGAFGDSAKVLASNALSDLAFALEYESHQVS